MTTRAALASASGTRHALGAVAESRAGLTQRGEGSAIFGSPYMIFGQIIFGDLGRLPLASTTSTRATLTPS